MSLGRRVCCHKGTQRWILRALWPNVVIIMCAGLLAACSDSTGPAAHVQYVTRYGLGPDKWATAWLLTRHVDPTGKLVVVEPTAELPEGVVFDEPVSDLRRIGNHSAFEIAKAHYRLDDPTLDVLAAVVHEIEINFWNLGGVAQAPAVENAFRDLQYRYGRGAVPPQCYLAFFDRVYQLLGDQRSRNLPITAPQLQLNCSELIRNAQRGDDLVSEVPLIDVLSAMAADRKVLFVDVREPDEFAEAHIPGALNIPIRDASPQLRERLANADYVVSYCVKDFRGFEMAKALADLGVKNSVIMRPYGIKGWIAEGLPVVGAQGLSQADVEAALSRCLPPANGCKPAPGTT